MVFECSEFVRQVQPRDDHSLNEHNKLLFSFFDVDYFTAFEHARFCIDAVRHLSFAGVFIKIKLWRIQGIMCTAGPRTGM